MLKTKLEKETVGVFLGAGSLGEVICFDGSGSPPWRWKQTSCSPALTCLQPEQRGLHAGSSRALRFPGSAGLTAHGGLERSPHLLFQPGEAGTLSSREAWALGRLMQRRAGGKDEVG